MSNLHKEIYFETESCEYLSPQGWHYAVGAIVDYEQARALFSATVTGKIDVNGLVNSSSENEAIYVG